MTVELTSIIILGLASVVGTLATIIFTGLVKENRQLKKANKALEAWALREAGKENDTVAKLAELIGRDEE